MVVPRIAINVVKNAPLNWILGISKPRNASPQGTCTIKSAITYANKTSVNHIRIAT
jgi:hypothetical protein